MPQPMLLRSATVLATALWLAVPLGAAAADVATDELEALLNQPVYAASKHQQAAAVAPASVTVLTAGDIRSYGWRTLGELLDAVRGVHLRKDRAYDYLGVRGVARPGDYNSRVLLLIDGVRVNDNVYDTVLIGREFPLDVSMIARVELIAGPGSALYGSNAVLGVVNVVTRAAEALSGGESMVAVGAKSSRKASATMTRRLGADPRDAALLLAASAETRPGGDLFFPELADPPASDGVARGNDGERDRKFYARLERGEWRWSLLASDRFKRIPNGQYATAISDPGNNYDDRLLQVGVQWQRRSAGGDEWTVLANGSRYDFHGGYAYPDGYAEETVARGRWWAGEARWSTQRFERQHLVLGLEWQINPRQEKRYNVTAPLFEEVTRVGSRSHRVGIFASDEIALGDAWRLTLGARVDRQASGDTTATPRLALVWQLAPRLVVKALSGSAYREPNVNEAQYFDTVSLANPALQRERSTTRELALDWRPRQDWRLAASAYSNRMRGVIEAVEISPEMYQYQNVAALRSRGVELESDTMFEGGWRLRASASRQRAHDATGQEVGNSPRWLAKLHLSAPLAGTPLRLGMEWLGVGTRLAPSGARVGAQGVANATLRFDPPGAPWSLALSVYNLGQRRLADPAGNEHAFDAIERDGRNAELRAYLRF